MPPIGDILSCFAIAGAACCLGKYARDAYHLWGPNQWDGKHPGDVPELNKAREDMAARLRELGVNAVIPKVK